MAACESIDCTASAQQSSGTWETVNQYLWDGLKTWFEFSYFSSLRPLRTLFLCLPLKVALISRPIASHALNQVGKLFTLKDQAINIYSLISSNY